MQVKEEKFSATEFQNFLILTKHNIDTGILRFTLLIWGHKIKPQKQKLRKSRLLSSTKEEENRIEL